MTSPATRPLPPEALRMLAVTAALWRVTQCSRPARPMGMVTGSELRRWPYWPAYPAAAAGWR
ncbi:MAG: hypothetical protein WBC18_10685 [Ottowia sp.]|uniref:hypothetical protein n=1 Tax=unclassified Ottowia TaxID=2645081 RepID=UPI003C2F288D